MVRITSSMGGVFELACRSAACRPPTSGGTGGSTKISSGGSGSAQLSKYIAGDSGVGVRSLKVKARGGSSTGDRFEQEVEYEQELRNKARGGAVLTVAKDHPDYKQRSAADVKGVMTEKEALDLVREKDATGRRILDKGIEPTGVVGVRANLNVKKSTGVTVQTLHAGSLDQYKKGTGMFGGEAIGYGAVVVLNSPQFSVNQEARAKILSKETNKFPMASVDGHIKRTADGEPTTGRPASVRDDIFDGVEVRFNPMTSHLFTDPQGRAVKSASQATIVGGSVFVRGNITYYGPDDMPKPARDLPSEAHS